MRQEKKKTQEIKRNSDKVHCEYPKGNHEEECAVRKFGYRQYSNSERGCRDPQLMTVNDSSPPQCRDV